MSAHLLKDSEPIPGYKLIERLGRGGFGEVWKAEAPGGLLKAVKFIYGDLESADDSVSAEQELKALNRVKSVRHPFILTLERVDVVDGQLVIVMELADRNLEDRYKECMVQGLPGIPRAELLGYMEETAEALDLMNGEYQLQHLDIKPANLFLVHQHVKVADFGLCKDLEGMKAAVTGGLTPMYASPETFDGWVSPFSDQYSLAIVYQEMLTGRRPFDGANALQLLMQHVRKPPDLSALPPEDQPIVGRALAKKPEERYPRCADFIQALRAARATVFRSTRPDERRRTTAAETRTLKVPQLPVHVPQRPASADASPTERPRPPLRSVQSGLGTTPTSATSATPFEPRERGVLVPALIVGLGRVGREAIQRLRQDLDERFGSRDAVPHLRLLYIDTDPDDIGLALTGGAGRPALEPHEVLLVRLNRPSHYLNPHDRPDGRAAAVTAWLEPKMLYRIPRSQLTTGIRALGRLAFVDNYRDVADRLRAELDACADPQARQTAQERTRLELRSDRPRAFVVAGLAGGTGSGMFIDLAYALRSLLNQQSEAAADVRGLLLLPETTQAGSTPLPLGNTFAALTELQHFSTADARYTLQPGDAGTDGPAFSRCFLVASKADEEKTCAAVGLLGDFLFRDLVTPLGRAADHRRASLSQSTGRPVPLVTFAAERWLWPRRRLVKRGAGRLAQRLINCWTAKDASPLQDNVQRWVREQWQQRQLGVGELLACLDAVGATMLRRPPQEMLAGLVDPFLARQKPDPAQAAKILEHVEEIIGRPESKDGAVQPTPWMAALAAAAKEHLNAWEQKLSEMAVQLIEQPGFRLAGAEEAMHRTSALLREILERQSALHDRLQADATAARQTLQTMLDGLTTGSMWGRRKTVAVDEWGPALRQYPLLRYQGQLLQHVVTIYRALLAACPEYLREFNHCRARLNELTGLMETTLQADAAAPERGAVRVLLPAGCRHLDDTVNQLLAAISPAELCEIDGRVQTEIRRRFNALVHVCTTPDNLLKEVARTLHEVLEPCVAARLGATGAVDVFLERYPGSAVKETAELAGAAARLASAAGDEASALFALVPTDARTAALTARLRQALPDAEPVADAEVDEITFHAEAILPELSVLPQFEPHGREAYEDLQAREHFTPHSRMDITDWHAPG